MDADEGQLSATMASTTVVVGSTMAAVGDMAG